jgi:hypothetical protein
VVVVHRNTLLEHLGLEVLAVAVTGIIQLETLEQQTLAVVAVELKEILALIWALVALV